ncbi:four-carbon acid sugar kinase family protein [Herbiconiux sp. UC225_62]|uniref:four-carbon acid sugar kinase family protein n=1 Tax=Herbiconiux sp. UC225_62 TaxID=3350168 RepID=UPI0036D246F1
MSLSPEVVIIADDLTGALDASAPFAERGFRPVVVPSFALESTAQADVAVLCSDSRDGAGGRARGRIAAYGDWIRTVNPRIVGLKVDSLLRGDPVGDLEVLLRASGRSGPILIAPALPRQGRTVVRGRVLVDGISLERTEHHSACVARGVAEAILPPGRARTHFSIRDIRSPGFQRRLRAGSGGFVVLDAETDQDLDAIVAAGLAIEQATWVGSSGLFSALARAVRRSEKRLARAATLSSENLLVVAGSASSATTRQLNTLKASGLRLHGVDPVEPTRDIAARVRHDLSVDGIAAIHSIRVRASAGALSAEHAARLADVVADLHDIVDGLVIVGGDTTQRVFRRLGVQSLIVTSALFGGATLGITRPAPGISFICKAGSFGDDRTLVRAVESLRAQKRTP